MKKHRIRQWLALCLTLVLTLTSLPLSVVAETLIPNLTDESVVQDTAISELETIIEEPISTVPDSTPIASSASKDVYIIQEDISKRGEFEKHYICSDGTFVVSTYAEAVHYQDDSGEWQDVDSRLTQGLANYVATTNDYQLSLPTATGQKIFSMNYGDKTFTWTLRANKRANTVTMGDVAVASVQSMSAPSLIPITETLAVSQAVTPQVLGRLQTDVAETSVRKYITDEDAFDLPNVSNQVRYDGMFGADEGISVLYTTYYNKVEEDIFIEKPTDIRSFSLVINAPNTTPRLNPDNSVDFWDADGELCYRVGVPYMVDAAHSVLNDINTTVTTEGNSFVITYTPDENWFTSAEREYPIMLDPSITTGQYTANIKDTYIEELDDESAANNLNSQYLYINEGDNGSQIAIVRITNFPEIPENLPIIEAKMTYWATGYNPRAYSLFFAQRIGGPAQLEDYTYETFLNTTNGFYCPAFTSTTSNQISVSLGTYFRELAESRHCDFALMLMDDVAPESVLPIYSSEYVTSLFRPVFSVVYGYALPDGLEVGKTYAFVNCASQRYMTAMSGSNGTFNVYQDGDALDTSPIGSQQFRLELDTNTGGYLLRPITTVSVINVVLDIVTNGNYPNTGDNIGIQIRSGNATQGWLFIPESQYTFRIVSCLNFNYCIETYGMNAGTPEGISMGSPGNIYVGSPSDHPAITEYQQWMIKDVVTGDFIENDISTCGIDSGIYYATNAASGQYLYSLNATVSTRRARKSQLAMMNYIAEWNVIPLADGYCLLGASGTNRYLSQDYTLDDDEYCYETTVSMKELSQNITEDFMWRIQTSGDGYTIQHKGSGDYLYELNSSSSPSGLAVASAYTAGNSRIWRFELTSEYQELSSFTINDTAIDVGEAITPIFTLTPTDAAWAEPSDFTYSVTPTGYVSIDSNTGNIAGIQEGEVTVTATHDTTGITIEFTVIIQNFLPDGVYAIKNVGNPNMWMDMRLHAQRNDLAVQQVAHGATYPWDSDVVRDGMFKITRIPRTSQYVIRLMTNNSLTFLPKLEDGTDTDDSDNYINTCWVPTENAEVDSNCTYLIEYTPDGYIIKTYDNQYMVAAREGDASGQGGKNASRLLGLSTTRTTDLAKWQFVPYTGPEITEVIWRNYAETVSCGTKQYFYAELYSTLLNVNGSCTYIMTETDIATLTNVEAHFRGKETIGEMMALKCGTITITAQFDNTTYESSKTVSITNVPSEEDTYFIRNAATSKYVDIEGPSTVEKRAIQQWAFNDSQQSRWIVEPAGGNYFRLRSIYNNFYITVDPAETTRVCQMQNPSEAQLDYSLWKLEGTESGNIRLICKATENSGKVMAVPQINSENGVDLVMITPSSGTDKRCEWDICPRKELSLIAVWEYYDRGYNYSEIIANYIGKGYEDSQLYSNHTTYHEDITKDPLLDRVMHSKIAVVHTHGSKTTIRAANSYITYGDIESMPDDAFAFCDLIIYAACSTAEGKENAENLVNITAQKGAKVVIGFSDSVEVGKVDTWTNLFLQDWNSDMTQAEIEQLCQFVLSEIRKSGNLGGVDTYYVAMYDS